MAQNKLNELKELLLTVRNRTNGYDGDDECWHCADPFNRNTDTYVQVWLFEGRTAILTHQCLADHSETLPSPTWILQDEDTMKSCREGMRRRLLYLSDSQVEQLMDMLQRCVELSQESFHNSEGLEPADQEEIEEWMVKDELMLEEVKAQLGL